MGFISHGDWSYANLAIGRDPHHEYPSGNLFGEQKAPLHELIDNSSNDYNVAMGMGALGNLRYGKGNVAVGSKAMSQVHSLGTQYSDNNVAIGSQAMMGIQDPDLGVGGDTNTQFADGNYHDSNFPPNNGGCCFGNIFYYNPDANSYQGNGHSSWPDSPEPGGQYFGEHGRCIEKYYYNVDVVSTAPSNVTFCIYTSSINNPDS
tara:strand:- start:512 stop:1123 length:612 start_codon:yes stop_codon:yes gene_type:complete